MTRIALASLLALTLVACDDTPTPTDGGCLTCGRDSGTTRRDAGGGGMDAGRRDSGVDAGTDAGPPDSGFMSSDAALGADCEYNFDCAADQFCACIEDPPDCACQIGARGARGTGEACDQNSECASGACFDDDNGVKACTAPCDTVADPSGECGGLFPACREFAFFGRICGSSETDGGL